MALSLKFYGTRGSIMSVSRDRFIYGGHTTCLTVKSNDDLLIIDAGFGIGNLGADLIKENPDISKGGHDFHLLLTHFHWDHIQGLQYFTPIYFPNNRIHVHTPFDVEVTYEVLNLLLDGSYTPFNGLDSLPCEWIFNKVGGRERIGPFSVSFHPTVHMDKCYAYRISTDEGRVVFITDHNAEPSPRNEELVKWATGCDMLVHEAMFTPGEYLYFPDFGHSSFVSALENAQRIGAANTLLTHHAHLRSDSELAEHERYLERLFNGGSRHLAFAREGVNYPVATSE